MAAISLSKNVDGTWDQSRDILRQDLDVIQRTINYLLVKPATAATTGQTEEEIYIDSSNKVTITGGDYITSVSTSNTGALLGDGTVASPLAVNPDGTTITVNGSNQLTVAVNVAAAGAITGNGSVANPLAAAVDGTTVKIVGNQLTSVSTSPTLTVTITVTDAQIQTLNSAPITAIAAQGSKKTIIVHNLAVWKSYTAGSEPPYGTAQSFQLRYSGTTTDVCSCSVNDTKSPSTGIAMSNPALSMSESGFGTTSGGVSNTALLIRANVDTAGSSGSGSNFLKFHIVYSVFDAN